MWVSRGTEYNSSKSLKCNYLLNYQRIASASKDPAVEFTKKVYGDTLKSLGQVQLKEIQAMGANGFSDWESLVSNQTKIAQNREIERRKSNDTADKKSPEGN
jgi:hypothetical protein